MKAKERVRAFRRNLTHMLAVMGMMLALLFVVQPQTAEAATKIQGIDVSKWQGTIDWAKVKKAGIKFVMIGTGRYKNGVATPDSKFDTNIEGAIEQGIYVGVYHYATATTVADMRNAADYVLDLVDGYKISYPIALDMEDDVYKSMTNAKRTKLAIAFMEVIEDAGYYPMIYASDNWFQDYMDLTSLAGYDYWVACWSYTPVTTPLSMWQYSSTGKVSGITTAVDLDYSYRDYSTIITPRTSASSRRSSSTGWQTDGTNHWYVEDDGTIPTSTWLTVNGRKYYVDANGYRVSGWVKINGSYYYFKTSSGVMHTGWLTVNNKTYYMDTSTGARRTGWLTVDGSKYYMNTNTGVLTTGWLTLDGNTYYLRKSSKYLGVMATGWLKVGSSYYYFDPDTGVMQKGWITVDGNTYFLNRKTGARRTGWLTLSGKKYYLRKSSKKLGVMATGWLKIGSKYYYFDPDTGEMQTGWVTVDDNTYFLNRKTGARRTGWLTLS
ncbi:MAG: hypothetical protein LUI07_05240, partial [Lachnospiraceae bacterium]|nr:hypothetical protein [Lachnospiraceae bacterium]